MKILLSLLCAVSVSSLVGMDGFDLDCTDGSSITHSLANEWAEVKPFKKSVYLPFFEKGGYKKEYLETRWPILKELFKTNIVSIILLKKAQKDVGFLTVEAKGENALLYTSPMQIDSKDINTVVSSAIKAFFPKVTTGYCIVGTAKPNFQGFLESLKWVETEESPITPNEKFVSDKSSYVIFTHAIENSK